MGTAEGAPNTDDIQSPKTARFRARNIAVLMLGLNLSPWDCRAVFAKLDPGVDGLFNAGWPGVSETRSLKTHNTFVIPDVYHKSYIYRGIHPPYTPQLPSPFGKVLK